MFLGGGYHQILSVKRSHELVLPVGDTQAATRPPQGCPWLRNGQFFRLVCLILDLRAQTLNQH